MRTIYIYIYIYRVPQSVDRVMSNNASLTLPPTTYSPTFKFIISIEVWHLHYTHAISAPSLLCRELNPFRIALYKYVQRALTYYCFFVQSINAKTAINIIDLYAIIWFLHNLDYSDLIFIKSIHHIDDMHRLKSTMWVIYMLSRIYISISNRI